MNELIVIAEREELKLVDKLVDKGILKKGITTLITGVGALNVISALKDIPKDTHIINIGYAGSKNLCPDAFYEVSKVTLNHPNVDYPEPLYKCNKFFNDLFSRPCYTGCDFVLKSDKQDCLFDMELAYISALGFENVSSIKYVSDNLDLQEYREKIE